MSATQRLYLETPAPLSCDAKVVEVRPDGVVLDQTPFYPQGGGQPSDTGKLGAWTVAKVTSAGDVVVHALEPQPLPAVGDTVHCEVDAEKRRLHARLHSAGHVVDMAISSLNLPWKPVKGFHFPPSPYVEYSGPMEGLDPAKLKIDLESACAKLLSEGTTTSVRRMPFEEARALCKEMPPGVPVGETVRMVGWGGFLSPCGGTHVSSLTELGALTIRKVKKEGANVRVGYAVA